MITLYGISTSRAGRCVWALEEIGVPYTHVPIHFNDGSTRRALMWSFWGNDEIENLLRPLLRNRLFLQAADRNAVEGDLAAEQLVKPLRILEGALADRDYLLGREISVADLNVSHGMFWLPVAGVEMAAYPRVSGWLGRLADRPALQKAWGGRRPEMDPANQRSLGEVDPRRGF